MNGNKVKHERSSDVRVSTIDAPNEIRTGYVQDILLLCQTSLSVKHWLCDMPNHYDTAVLGISIVYVVYLKLDPSGGFILCHLSDVVGDQTATLSSAATFL
jgi:hypothetical protein